MFVAEGTKVITAALDAHAPVEGLYCAPDVVSDRSAAQVVERAAQAGVRVHHLASGVMEYVADTVTPQPVAAVVGFVDVPLGALASPAGQVGPAPASLVVVCVGVRDPGNAGTILRSAEAAGATGLVFCDGSVDVYNPKTVRASAGSLFYVPVVAGGDAEVVLDQLGSWGLRRLGAVADQGDDPELVDLVAPIALVVGNEATGLPEGVAPHLDARLRIPMAGRVESLNVAMASAVICFEAARQRRASGHSGPASQAAPGRGGADGAR